jgi:co-chaperonin GroES (HSP10)
MANNQKNTKVSIQPLADRVLVRREDMPDKKSASGIIIPDTAQKEKSKLGTVVAVGPRPHQRRGETHPYLNQSRRESNFQLRLGQRSEHGH